ncbi:uncharacterized protein BDZ99DRAFT_468696 [Mytilinidion resinicola]|uniref:Uncharacterized protein n=1 Tax=Mytilinidion resinicola TaxID=574789 RepID=A0A6A6Y1M6_9PEZI|nr:uncharacterized protein BDZ99DRAFT_468696 [Mytilinidion resinicola]KAF2802716.1 hypothetical protein BDZ99DRAFT_468696 [Mytilinidion resinicola]
MPSFSRSSTMPTAIHPSDSKKEARVGFPSEPVTSVLRPVNSAESWAAYNFESHARKCAYCHNPYEVHRSHEQLCDVGHRLAQDVAHFLYINAEGESFATEKEDHKVVRVEIPVGYDEVRGLLKAIERSLRHRSRRPFVSMDRTYYVSARVPLPDRSRSVKIAQASKPVKVHRPRSGEIVDWPTQAATAQQKAKVTTEVSHSKRGSLYASDVEQQRRDSVRYNVEVREPSKWDIREHRLSGYYS